MGKFKGTPAPWTIIATDDLGKEGSWVDVALSMDDKTGKHIDIWMHSEDHKGEGLANAKLIAAAPELLHALQNLVDAVEEMESTDQYLSEAKSAINKAIGIPTNSTDPLTQSRIMEATKGLNLEEGI